MVHQETYDKYAIFANGGKQYQAIEGQTIAIEKIDGEAGDTIELGSILYFSYRSMPAIIFLLAFFYYVPLNL